MKYYAGIGSRSTPSEVLQLFEDVGAYLAKKGYILRSGAAQGADQAFERGNDSVNGQKEIYLPWSGFENSTSTFIVKDKKAFEIAEQFHPYWQNLKQGAKKLIARDVHQMLGWDLQTPSSFVICWTKNGSGEGGSGQCIRIAKHYNRPVFDAGKWKDIEEIKKNLRKFLKENVV